MKRAFYAFLVVLALTELVAPYAMYQDEPHFSFENWPAFGSVFGFLACVAIILISKMLGKLWLMRSENYYDS